ncbi:hypothetical protein ACFVAV_21600 [Nocardia sp. NPDC057663]|uniref:hypothetical protein n=1 Tax=Nocardia sp. NPDC057663 TaxID=3346201 RepID=UPI003671AD58
MTIDEECYLVDPSDLDAWYRWRWTFTWRGQPFNSGGETDDGMINGYFEGNSQSWAEENGLFREEQFIYTGVFPLDEISDLKKENEDLLAWWKEQQNDVD